MEAKLVQIETFHVVKSSCASEHHETTHRYLWRPYSLFLADPLLVGVPGGPRPDDLVDQPLVLPQRADALEAVAADAAPINDYIDYIRLEKRFR